MDEQIKQKANEIRLKFLKELETLSNERRDSYFEPKMRGLRDLISALNSLDPSCGSSFLGAYAASEVLETKPAAQS